MSEVSVWIGFDPREVDAYAVARNSCLRNRIHAVNGLVLPELRRAGLYTRPTLRMPGPNGKSVLYDEISEHSMATEFAISRFLVPYLVRNASPAGKTRWALFMDCDMLVRKPLDALFDQADESKAVMVVKHRHEPVLSVKMDGQEQSKYSRKNWSSVMLFNVDHPSNAKLDLDLVNSVPGRDLHGFCWLADEEIGELSVEFNYLVGHNTRADHPSPSIVHYTDGVPSMSGYEDCEYSDEWRSELLDWVVR